MRVYDLLNNAAVSRRDTAAEPPTSSDEHLQTAAGLQRAHAALRVVRGVRGDNRRSRPTWPTLAPSGGSGRAIGTRGVRPDETPVPLSHKISDRFSDPHRQLKPRSQPCQQLGRRHNFSHGPAHEPAYAGLIIRRKSPSNVKILVVDDDASIRDFLKLHLEKARYAVMLAGDGKAGGELAVSATPHVVLIDVDMPYANGYGLFQRLKADAATRDIPVVFLTTDDDVEQRAIQLGAAACLRKPLSVERLLKVVGLLTRGAA